MAEVVTPAGVVLPDPFTVLVVSAGEGDGPDVGCLWLESHANNSSSVNGIFLKSVRENVHEKRKQLKNGNTSKTRFGR